MGNLRFPIYSHLSTQQRLTLEYFCTGEARTKNIIPSPYAVFIVKMRRIKSGGVGVTPTPSLEKSPSFVGEAFLAG